MDDEDDTPLAMLPASTSAARHTALSAEQTPVGPVRQLPQLSNPASSDIPDALPASSSTPGEQSDTPAAGQSVQVKTALLPSMQDAAHQATDLPTSTPSRGDTCSLDAAERTDGEVAVPSTTALPSAEARQAVCSSPAQVEGDMAQGRHDPPQPAVSMREQKANMASGLQAVSGPRKSAEAGRVDNPHPTHHQDHLISDSESEGPSGILLPGASSPAEGMPGPVTDAAAPVHTSNMITLEAAGEPSSSPCHTQQQPQQQHSTNDPAAGDGSTVVNSSVSLLQAEAEAARLAVLLAPPVYRPPALAHQLACMGTGLPVQNTGTSTSCTQAPLHAQSGSPQAASMAADKVLPAEVQSGTCESRIAEAEWPELVQCLQAAGGLPTLLKVAQLPGHSRQNSMQQQNAEAAASSGLQQLAMQVNQHRLKSCGDSEAVNEGPASSFEQEDATVIHEADAADVVIPDR